MKIQTWNIHTAKTMSYQGFCPFISCKGKIPNTNWRQYKPEVNDMGEDLCCDHCVRLAWFWKTLPTFSAVIPTGSICLRFESSGSFGQIESTLIFNFRVISWVVLAFLLLGGEEWKLLAEKLGLSPAEIRFLDSRTRNPCIEVLSYVRNQRFIDVGTLYDALVECGFPMLADML